MFLFLLRCFFILLCIFCHLFFCSFEEVADWLMCLPLLELAVARAIPCVLAGRASLFGWLATVCTLRVVHEVLEDLVCVKVHQSVKVFLLLLDIRVKLIG